MAPRRLKRGRSAAVPAPLRIRRSVKRQLFLLAFTACATAASAAEPYTALGTEPFWSIEIADGRITYDTPYERFSVAAPQPSPTGEGRRYETERLTVEIEPGVCNDGMSDNLYADTVTVTVDGALLSGCGGGHVAVDHLPHSRWLIEQIDGEPVWEAGYEIEFGADRISGQAGCNRFSGSYSRSGADLVLGSLTATRRLCRSEAMAHERRAFRILTGTLRIDSGEGDSLVLTGPGGSLRLLREF